MLHFPLTLETKKINLIRRGSCENVLRTKLYLYLGGTWRKKKNPKQNKTHTQKKQKPWCNPRGRVDDEFRCSASAVKITKLWAQWGIIRVQTWAGLRERNSDCASAELKQLGAQEWGEGTISMETGFIFWSMRVTHCGSPCTAWKSSKTCLRFVDAAQVDVRKCGHLHTHTHTHTHTHRHVYTASQCIKKCVWRYRRCTC